MDNFDFSGMNTAFANSAETAARIAEANEVIKKQVEAKERAKIKRETDLIQETKKHNELLEQQLQAVQEQNKQLKEQCDYLKNLYETAKEEAQTNAATAQKNAKDAMHNKIFGWVSFAVGTAIGIIGIIVGALI